MAVFEPKQFFFLFGQQIGYFRITELDTVILPILLILPSQRLIKDKTGTAAKLFYFADLCVVWHDFELKGFAYYHSGMIIPLVCVCALYLRPEGRSFTAQG